jgi:hypothetical protein
MPSEMYASCKIWPGMFDSELLVVVGDVSAVVDKSNVRLDKPYPTNEPYPKNGTYVAGSVLVYVVEEEQNRLLVELPGQAVVGGLRTWVPRDILAAA